MGGSSFQHLQSLLVILRSKEMIWGQLAMIYALNNELCCRCDNERILALLSMFMYALATQRVLCSRPMMILFGQQALVLERKVRKVDSTITIIHIHIMSGHRATEL